MGGYGYIDTNGKVVIPSFHGTPYSFSERLARIPASEGWNFIDPQGKVKLHVDKAFVGFSNGLAQTDRGFIDKKGKVVLPVQYKANFTRYIIAGANYGGINAFHDGLVRVGRYGPKVGDAFLDKAGKIVLDGFAGGLAGDFQAGKALVQIKNPPQGETCRRIDRRGRCLAVYSWSSMGPFSEGMAPVRENGKIGFIDDAGKMVFQPAWESWDGDLSCRFSEGLAPIKVGNQWGFIDRKGGWKITPRFELVGGFSEGLAVVRVGTGFGYLNTEGRIVIEPRFNYAVPFSHGLAVVGLDIL